MSRDEVFLTLFLYILVILISSSRPFWGSLSSLGWVNALAAYLRQPVHQEEPVVAEAKPAPWERPAARKTGGRRKKPDLPSAGMTTANKNSAKEETSKS